VIITLTTDFGASEYVAAMKGVILGINRNALIVDVRHDVAPGNVAEGAFALFHAAPHFPFTVHVGVVDPGVGTERRGLAVVCEGAIFVGPDNGLLIPAARRMGIKDVRHLTNDAYWRHPVHPTFQGRDVFAPVAAHLTLGAKVADLGPSIRDVVELDFGRPEETQGGMAAEIIYVDRFGNMVTNIPGTDAESRWPYGATVRVKIVSHDFAATFLRTYGMAAPGAFLLTVGSHGFLEIAANGDSAALRTGVRLRDRVVLGET
jgi:S-adenosylmethionine hydrolase